MAADLRYTVYEYQPRLLNQLCEPGGLIADRRMTARGATLPLTVAWAKDQPARHYRECHGSASTEITVDIWCSASAASRTSLSAIFPASTQTMPRHAGSPRSTMAAAFSAQGFHTTLEAAPSFSMTTRRRHPRSSMAHRPGVSR